MTQLPSSPSLWQRSATALLRIVLVLSATALLIGALLLGMVVASGVVLWALLRRRRPGPVHLRWARMLRAGRFGRPGPGASADEVVDVQAREVQGPPLR